MYTFVPNKPFGSLLEISPTNHFLKAFYSEFQDIEVWFKDQKSHPLDDFCLLPGYTWVHMGTHATKVAKNLSNKYGQKLLNSGKKPTISWNNKSLKKSLKELLATGLHSKNDHANSEIEVPKKDAYLQKKDNKLLLN